MRMRCLPGTTAIRLALVLSAFAGSASAQAQNAAPADAATVASAPATVQINNVINSGATARGRRGPAGNTGPPGPAGASGPAGSPGVVQIVQSCASCASGDGQGGVPIGALVTALIGGLFGVLGLVITKENKTSEFRQAWVDALRNDIADFASAVKSFVFYEKGRQEEVAAKNVAKAAEQRAKHREHELEYEKLLKDAFEKTVHAQMRIRLRINAEESEERAKSRNDALLDQMVQIQTRLNADEPDFDGAERYLNDLHFKAAPILKAEWERVKKGETPYVVAKTVLISLLVVGAILFGVMIVKSA